MIISYNTHHVLILSFTSLLELHPFMRSPPLHYNISPPKPSWFLFLWLFKPPSISQQVQQERISIKVNLVSTSSHDIRNISCGINTTKFHETRIILDRLSNEHGRFSLSSCSSDNGLLFLLCSNHNVLCSLSVLLSYIFLRFDEKKQVWKRQVRSKPR